MAPFYSATADRAIPPAPAGLRFCRTSAGPEPAPIAEDANAALASFQERFVAFVWQHAVGAQELLADEREEAACFARHGDPLEFATRAEAHDNRSAHRLLSG